MIRGRGKTSVNMAGIRQLTADIQRGFDQNPVYVRVQADKSEIPEDMRAGQTIHNTYNAPVFYAPVNGRAQFAWNNEQVSQQQTETVAPGYEAITQAVIDVFRHLPDSGISDTERKDVAIAGGLVLQEVSQPEPDPGKVQWAVNALSAFLKTVLVGAASTKVQEWVTAAIQRLTAATF